MTTTTAPGATAGPPTADVRVVGTEPLPSPATLFEEAPGDPVADSVRRSRDAVRAVLDGVDDRLLVVVGPCSIHDPDAGLEYAGRLAAEARRLEPDLLVVMRTYFEKPRTTVGWKGLVNDPHLDGSHDIGTGLRTARRFLLDVNALGLACATEFLEPITPQYLADLVTWGAIGARTAESQIHRQLVSGLSMPVGIKNGTDGGLQVAVDGCRAAAAAQTFLGIDAEGRAALVRTTGNTDTHLVLRGGASGPNHSREHVQAASDGMAAAGLNPRVLVDASHANSGKDHRRQPGVAADVAEQVAAGGPVAGVMLESFLVEGRQPLDVAVGPSALVRGQSVTDACLGWEQTVEVLDALAAAVGRARRTDGRGWSA
ncbi:3-deoxy-7-phosphoheptulonate synthase [Desertihabitans brevis]|uniref:Phospho-2-dehydro-3-deoxyheptonate aldolase n=1 Tax=Desertihabitans brevis TaxID=2268447 RepID=A0A367YSS4_9ACTN|nr:3-deoxy-7-phosphoheptulonate synthase [Desertihabitans brevis]RCK68945.1 3-deoxy-7-phosphoheptulonate synthase [Desertihabitans brevis]